MENQNGKQYIDDAEFILQEEGITPTKENIRKAVQIMVEALKNAIQEGKFDKE